ncbi:MAG: phosphopantetheine-binding protein [Nevskiaceae bacterium]|jgi:acyl carrier protein|nr:phosphopantetheine-binding protein [Nevskiaceae bacterium]
MPPEAALLRGLKKMVIRECNVRDITLEEIGDDEPIIGERLPLDSLDAVEIVAALERYFGIRLESAGASRKVFRSFRTMAEFVSANANGEKIAIFVTRFH